MNSAIFHKLFELNTGPNNKIKHTACLLFIKQIFGNIKMDGFFWVVCMFHVFRSVNLFCSLAGLGCSTSTITCVWGLFFLNCKRDLRVCVDVSESCESAELSQSTGLSLWSACNMRQAFDLV